MKIGKYVIERYDSRNLKVTIPETEVLEKDYVVAGRVVGKKGEEFTHENFIGFYSNPADAVKGVMKHGFIAASDLPDARLVVEEYQRIGREVKRALGYDIPEKRRKVEGIDS